MDGAKSINWKYEHISKCVNSSFVDGDYEKDNNRLHTMLENWHRHGTHIYPSIVINDVTFRG